jgi:hypothetical protein
MISNMKVITVKGEGCDGLALYVPLLGVGAESGQRIVSKFNPITHGPLSAQSLGFKT